MDAYSNTVYVAKSGGKAENPEDEENCLITGRNYQGKISEGMTQIQLPTLGSFSSFVYSFPLRIG